MDDSGHRENGRRKPDQYKSVHTQWMMPQHQMKDHHAMKFMAIIAERDSAVQECNLAISEKKAALAERDVALLQRDTAIAERNNAIIERDNAIAALEYNARDNGMNGNGRHGCPPGCTAPRGARHINHHHHHLPHSSPQFPDASYSNHPREMHISEAFPISTSSKVAGKSRRTKRPRKESKAEEAVLPKKASKSQRKSKRGVGGEDLKRQVTIAEMHHGEWNKGQEMEAGGEDVGKHHHDHQEWKGLQDLGLNQVTFDDSTMPVPVCSCTGKYQQCYKWGNGGWQSACCTTTLSMYPLPVMPNKRHGRVGGRKMSGNVFTKLLSRLAAEGHDLSAPLDLKDHWAKHGTNRYITIR